MIDGLEKFFYAILTKGLAIGLFAGILKIMQDIRIKSFRWHIALTDLFASGVVGYSIYEWASEAKSLHEWQVILITVILSLNAFLVVKILTDPKMITMLIKNWLKVNANVEESDSKKDEK